jgi:vacuolar-type H+-ATPase subunit E/Vma4
MSLENLRKALLADAQQEAEAVRREAQANAEAYVAQRLAQAEQEAERHFHRESRAVEEEFKRKLTALRTEKNKALLERRNALVRMVFERARHQVLHLPESDYAAWLRRLLHRTAEQSGGVLIVHSEDRVIAERLVTEWNNAHGSEKSLTLAEETLPERGGFILRTPQYEIDATLGSLLGEVERVLAPEIAARLFAHTSTTV